MTAYYRNDKGEFIEFTKQVLADLLSKDVDDIEDYEFKADIFFNQRVAYYRDLENVIRPFEYYAWRDGLRNIPPSSELNAHYQTIHRAAIDENLDLRSMFEDDEYGEWRDRLPQKLEEARQDLEKAHERLREVERDIWRAECFEEELQS